MFKTLFATLALVFPLVAFTAVEAPNGEASTELQAQLPTENTDGSVLNDLDAIRFYWGRVSGDYLAHHEVDVNPEDRGTTVLESMTVTVTGNYGDNVTVFYAATAVDEQDNESAFSNEVSRIYTIVDNVPPAPPTLQFVNQTVQINCVTPEGETCYLVEKDGA